MKKTFIVIATLMLMSLLLAACLGVQSNRKVALMLARGGLGDKGFNDNAHEGLQYASMEFNIDVKAFEYQPDAQEENIRKAAQEGYPFIIGLGAENSAAITAVAKEFPEIKFAIVDATAEGDNVTSVTFSELEGDFLAGALSALMSENGKVGYLGGADVLVIRRIQFGFEQGAKYVNPNIEVIAQNVGGKDDFSGFAKPDEAKKIAAQMYADGADVIYAAAGGSTLGAIEAAKESSKPIITTGTDQRSLAPELIASSRTKNMNVAVYHLIDLYTAQDLNGDPIQLDYKTGGVGLAPLADFVSSSISKQFESIRKDVESGKIVVEPFMGE
jgi:basic membrane protein A